MMELTFYPQQNDTQQNNTKNNDLEQNDFWQNGIQDIWQYVAQ
jgi:hypothetical protein